MEKAVNYKKSRIYKITWSCGHRDNVIIPESLDISKFQDGVYQTGKVCYDCNIKNVVLWMSRTW